MNSLQIALLQLESVIAGVESNSEIPVQLSELKMLHQLIKYAEAPAKLILSRASAEEQPTLRAVPMTLFPTLESLQSVVDLAKSQLPVTSNNAMQSLLMIYHNSLLKVIERDKS